MNRMIASGCICVLGLTAVAHGTERPAGDKPPAPGRPRATQMKPAAGEQPAAAEKAEKKPAYLGITTDVVPAELRAQLDLPEDGGLLVREVTPDSPAAKAGVEAHDILVQFDDRDVTSPLEFAEMIEAAGVGKHVPLTVVRRGRKLRLRVVLGERIDDRAVGRGPAREMPPAFPGLPLDLQQQAAAALAQGLAQAVAGGGPMGTVQIQTSVTNGVVRSTATASDDEGTVEIRVHGDQRSVSIRDAAGKEVFTGRLARDADFKQIPDAWREKVRALDARAAGQSLPAGRRPPRGDI